MKEYGVAIMFAAHWKIWAIYPKEEQKLLFAKRDKLTPPAYFAMKTVHRAIVGIFDLLWKV